MVPTVAGRRPDAVVAQPAGPPGCGAPACANVTCCTPLPQLPGQGVLVSNAVGHGDVPPGELTPRFVDEAGRRRQALALQCGPAMVVVAGLPMVLTGEAV
ncbi:bifunctional adenosylcobinamide kinase/adenosylcobinamide-phosphate guanylyltransferase [Xanthomonas cannabis]|uniref:bifunctional adenosylcobinamide kinase/adenosylcobinamide-phosphate guanylyltransferase n=1 Tax=Xanthomonas cannabis TaxID=1885674 RepID=UPI001FBAACD8|nr:bifunctional adenosylcobinamide kinase/adenosylcobinamide-phosphate guanylyltransferase [Xanthomonas cannabis]